MKLIVAPEGQFTAERLLGSQFRVQTPNNEVNAIVNMQSIPQGYRVNQYITLPNFWAILTDAQDGFKHYIREKLETDVYADFSTDNLLCKALECYSFGITNFRAIYGSTGV